MASTKFFRMRDCRSRGISSVLPSHRANAFRQHDEMMSWSAFYAAEAAPAVNTDKSSPAGTREMSGSTSRRSPEAFLDQLTELVVSEGVSKFTVGELAGQLRCSRRRLYEVAQTRDELFLVATQRLFDTVLQKGFDAARSKQDASRAMQAYLEVGVVNSSRLSLAFQTDLQATPKARAIYDRYQQARAQGLQALVDAGIAKGSFASHDARVVAAATLGAAHWLRQPEVLEGLGLGLDQAFRALYKLLMEGLNPR